MRKLQRQGVHHATIVGADRQTSISLWEGVRGMPFVFEEPNLGTTSESLASDRSRRSSGDHSRRSGATDRRSTLTATRTPR